MLIEAAGLAILAAISSPARCVQAFNGWLRRNGRMILACPLAAVGLIVAIDGQVGQTKKG
jgi:hypothetical protein